MLISSNYFLREHLNEFCKPPFFVFLPQFNDPVAKVDSASKKVFKDLQGSSEEYVLEERLLCPYSADQAVYERTMKRTSDNRVVFEDLYFAGFDYSHPQEHQILDPSIRA